MSDSRGGSMHSSAYFHGSAGRASFVASSGFVALSTLTLTLAASLKSRCQRRAASEEDAASPLDKAVWSAAESIGNAKAALFGDSKEYDDGSNTAAQSQEELIRRLRLDYDRQYFLTGDVDVMLYAEDCEFADPFASFRGRDRFVQNLRNLAGGFITNFRVKLLDLDSTSPRPDELEVRSRLRVLLELGLPWKPVLGWVWGVTHECQKTPADAWQCTVHRESWEIDPAEGVAMVFRPGKGLPTE
eukprot:TRINITY_DN73649_c0_g1_i2.p1 TRINITY_DN73649_c0_g1~~TRINITY_DN73649_c0_g1_i2.p1  ORF type:complete len:244 (-),score=43.10 TRINITY_DN73649_c0_g1_i2:262-993(-)